jgi:hypothetical protein
VLLLHGGMGARRQIELVGGAMTIDLLLAGAVLCCVLAIWASFGD